MASLLLRSIPLSLPLVIVFIFIISFTSSSLLPPISRPVGAGEDSPVPAVWPEQFHALLMMNFSGALSLIDLWYDWPNGRNFNIIRDQLSSSLFYDLEWNNGTSFFYRLDPGSEECRSAQVGVGILRPNWLDGATYLGQLRVNGFLCNVWEKVDFIWYYEDVATKRPVKWIFYTGRLDRFISVVKNRCFNPLWVVFMLYSLNSVLYPCFVTARAEQVLGSRSSPEFMFLYYAI